MRSSRIRTNVMFGLLEVMVNMIEMLAKVTEATTPSAFVLGNYDVLNSHPIWTVGHVETDGGD